jgi:hypothetical protein
VSTLQTPLYTEATSFVLATHACELATYWHSVQLALPSLFGFGEGDDWGLKPASSRSCALLAELAACQWLTYAGMGGETPSPPATLAISACTVCGRA